MLNASKTLFTLDDSLLAIETVLNNVHGQYTIVTNLLLWKCTKLVSFVLNIPGVYLKHLFKVTGELWIALAVKLLFDYKRDI